MKLRWTGKNREEIERVLSPYRAAVDRAGDLLRLRLKTGDDQVVDVFANVGDEIEIDDEDPPRIGVKRTGKKPLLIVVDCAICGKPIESLASIAQDPETIGIACGGRCTEALLEKSRHLMQETRDGQ